MTRDEAIARLRYWEHTNPIPGAGYATNDLARVGRCTAVLCHFLNELGYADVVTAFEKVALPLGAGRLLQ